MTISPNDLVKSGLIIDDSGLFCGTQPDYSMRFSSRPIKLNFRSDIEERFKGFLIDIMCADPVFNFRDTQTKSIVSPNSAPLTRVRIINIHVRGKRLSVMPPIMNGNCTELGEFSPLPLPVVSLKVAMMCVRHH